MGSVNDEFWALIESLPLPSLEKLPGPLPVPDQLGLQGNPFVLEPGPLGGLP